MAQRILVLHGPNLNLLGTREPHVYGHTTLDALNAGLVELARSLGSTLTAVQSNHDGALVGIESYTGFGYKREEAQ